MKRLTILFILTLCIFINAFSQQYVSGSLVGTMLEYTIASDFNYYYFCSDGRLMHDLYYFDIKKYGTWKMVGDTIKLEYKKIEGLRGIGEAKSHPLGANLPYYDEMVFFVEYCNQKDFLLLHEIEKDISKDQSINYKIWKANIDCSTLNFNVELPGDYYIASSKILSDEELKQYSKNDLLFMRNEIFARYGYIFNTPALKDHFKTKDWYKPKSNNVEKYLTEIEKINLAKIKELER